MPLPFTPGKVPFSSPKTGYPSDETGKIVAENIIRVAKGEAKLKKKAWGRIPGLCVMDAGKKEVLLLSTSCLGLGLLPSCYPIYFMTLIRYY